MLDALDAQEGDAHSFHRGFLRFADLLENPQRTIAAIQNQPSTACPAATNAGKGAPLTCPAFPGQPAVDLRSDQMR
jgi:hypothetical protein